MCMYVCMYVCVVVGVVKWMKCGMSRSLIDLPLSILSITDINLYNMMSSLIDHTHYDVIMLPGMYGLAVEDVMDQMLV